MTVSGQSYTVIPYVGNTRITKENFKLYVKLGLSEFDPTNES